VVAKNTVQKLVLDLGMQRGLKLTPYRTSEPRNPEPGTMLTATRFHLLFFSITLS
jgi:hypothetical protein